jgi:hypothetical protein
MAAVLWFFSYVPFMFMSEQYENLSLPAKVSACLFSNSAMAFGFQLFLMYEGTGRYLLNLPASLPEKFFNNLKPSMVMVNHSLGHLCLLLRQRSLGFSYNFVGYVCSFSFVYVVLCRDRPAVG